MSSSKFNPLTSIIEVLMNMHTDDGNDLKPLGITGLKGFSTYNTDIFLFIGCLYIPNVNHVRYYIFLYSTCEFGDSLFYQPIEQLLLMF